MCELNPPIYDIDKSWRENLEKGPLFSKRIPKRELPPEEQWVDFLGHPIASPLGVAAGPLLDSKWIDLAGRLGFDVLTYKTISHQERSSHPLPNIVYLDAPEMLAPTASPQKVTALDGSPTYRDLAITNSFGNPCRDADFLLKDIARANASIGPGQVMVVSIFGFGEDLKKSFVDSAALAKDAGAKIVEANLSCPNVGRGEGALYLDPVAVEELTRALVATLGDVPLILKVGAFPSQMQLEATVIAAGRAGAQGLSGINTLFCQIVDTKGKAALGPDRPNGGVCGNPIRQAGQSFVRGAKMVIDAKKLDLCLIGVGGALEPSHFDQYLNLGAVCVQTAAGMMWNPLLAAEYHARNLIGAS